MPFFNRFICCATVFVLAFHSNLTASPFSDYAAVTRGVRSIPMSGTAGGMAVIGNLAFPIVIAKQHRFPIAAGYFEDRESGGRVAGFAHTSLSDVRNPTRKKFLQNLVRWVGRSSTPRMACGPRVSVAHWKDAGFNVVAINTPLTAESLSKVDVVMLNLHGLKAGESIALLRDHAKAGKGVIFTGTPWAVKPAIVETVNSFLAEAGLAFHNEYTTTDAFAVQARLPSAYYSALPAISALNKERAGRLKLDSADRTLAALSVEQGLAHRPAALGLNKQIDALNSVYGWIKVSKAAPLVKARAPVQAMLARYQANLLGSLPADQVTAHPSAAQWPGAVPASAKPVTRTVSVPAHCPSDRLINSGRRGRRVNTGLYAPPGTVLKISIPDRATDAGLVAQIGVHVDKTFHLKRWKRFPHISREWKLNQPVTKIAGAFGGLVIIGVPPGCALGDIEIKISGGVPAPAFVLGKTTAEEWNSGLKEAPGAWGYIESTDFCSYLSRSVLAKIDDPERVARYWQSVMSAADKYLGYGDWRKRGEGAYTDLDISVGYGHAGYPVVMAYGDSDALVKRGPDSGDWGFLHEIGHTFQDSFDGNYTIATHAEVDVNLVPGIAKMLIHDETCIDNRAHNTFNAKPRLAAVKLFQALPPAEQTWDRACKSPAAYDFYFTLAECFGWELYERAFGRLMGFLKYPDDEPELKALNQRNPNNKRDRFFLLFCQESGHNLLPHFRKYGIGKGKHGLSPEVISKVTQLPEWSGNRPVRISNKPNRLALPKTGKIVHQFQAIDPDPGTIFTWTISDGNSDSAFRIERRTGKLMVANPTAAKQTYTLTIHVSDSTSDQSTDTAVVRMSPD